MIFALILLLILIYRPKGIFRRWIWDDTSQTIEQVLEGYALKDCTLDVKEGKITSIIGLNGAGKTTLFNTICSIIQPDHGEIWVKRQEDQRACGTTR